MDTWVSPDDVLDAWIGEDRPTNSATLSKWIGRAERLLRREFPTLQTRLESELEPDLQDTIVDVVSSMVTRVFRNPQGLRQTQETTGQFTASMTFAGNNPGGLYLEDSERDSLRPPNTPKAGQAFSVGLTSITGSLHLPWCDRMFGVDRCSCGLELTGETPIYELG